MAQRTKAVAQNLEVITIDGPAGAGKSTVAKELARRLGIFYLDTGAMYRALTLKAIRSGTGLEQEQALVDLARRTDIRMENGRDGVQVFLDGEDVSEPIRSPEVTNKTFYIARAPGVREIMVGWQRKIGSQKSVVIEGRDVGTVVFPKASHKFYLDADFEERARRRIDELKARGKKVDDENLKTELKERDHKDFTRTVGPLKVAEDAVVIDTTPLTVNGTVDEILKHIQK
ncbi:MAG: (d)CMP kinase [Candidatus Omnitrophica bacterium]|nr:(d)CMP kinase [Candidatus Omnitrophota bacterium]